MAGSMLRVTNARHVVQERVVSRALLEGFLHKGLSVEDARKFSYPRAERELLECCTEDVNHLSECVHVRRFYQNAFPESANASADLVQLMCEVHKTVHTCPALREWYLALAGTVAVEAEHGLRSQLQREGFNGDFTGRRARMRIDLDFKAVVTKRVMAGHASSIRQYLRAQGNEWPSGMSGDDWQSLELQRLLLSIRKHLSLDGQIGICVDGSRFGTPSEETLAYALWHSGAQRFAWLIPQVIAHAQHIRQFENTKNSLGSYS
eukprot:3523576-Amphidinium_carterae.1